MNGESIFSRRLLIVWIVAAALTFAVSLYFMGSKDQGNTVGPSAFSRSAIGYAGIADVLQKLGIDVVKSRSDSLGKLSSGSGLVIAEPLPGGVVQQHLQLAAVRRVLRPVVAGLQAAGLAVHIVPVKPNQCPFPRLNADAIEHLGTKAQLVKFAHGIGLQIDAYAERLKIGGRLEYPTGHADLLQGEGDAQPADSGA